VVAGSDGWGGPTSSPADNLLGRCRRRLTAPVTARAAGNAGTPDLDIDSDVRGTPAAYPGHGTGGRNTGSTSFGGRRHAQAQMPGAWYDPGGPGGAFGGGWADGLLTVRDRHVMTRRGSVRNPAGGGSSMPSPEKDGPPPPRYQMVDTTESWQIGTDKTTQEDNPGPHYTVDAGGRPFPLGQQDGNQTHVMGPPIGEWREYGTRGPAGMHGPRPALYAVAGDGSGQRVGTLLEDGEAGSEPTSRLLYGGVPHGLHSPTIPPRTVTMARQAAIPQQTPPRVDRPASSRIAGQSYSQTVVPQSQAGTAQSPMPRMAGPGRLAGIQSRFVARG
jgi:hypothetical protein